MKYQTHGWPWRSPAGLTSLTESTPVTFTTLQEHLISAFERTSCAMVYLSTSLIVAICALNIVPSMASPALQDREHQQSVNSAFHDYADIPPQRQHRQSQRLRTEVIRNRALKH